MSEVSTGELSEWVGWPFLILASLVVANVLLERLQAFRMGEGREQIYRENVPFHHNRETGRTVWRSRVCCDLVAGAGMHAWLGCYRLAGRSGWLWLVAESWLGAVEVQWCSGAYTGTVLRIRRLWSRIPGPRLCRALLWIRSSLLRWDLAVPIQASGAYSNTGRMKPLYPATRPWWSSTRAARCKKPKRCLARVETLWRWWRKARFESKVTPSNFGQNNLHGH